MAINPWCFDSWAVMDGVAFVSRRQPETIDATSTVFLSVPDLEPVPIGRISTALRAQRSSFQDGFRDPDNGLEFTFDDLSQVQEIIRRAYLAGGLGPAPAPVEGPPPSPFRGEPPVAPLQPNAASGGDYYEAQLQMLGDGSGLLPDMSDLGNPMRRTELLIRVHQSADAIYPFLVAFAEATLLECVHAHRDRLHLPATRETLRRWCYLLNALGLIDLTQPDRLFMEPLSQVIRGFDRPWFSAPIDKEILFRIPCPLRAHWYREIQTLGHKLYMPLALRDYFSYNRELPEFIPLLLCALIVTLAPELTVSRMQPMQSADRRRIIGRACEWLARELPRLTIPPAVESALFNFAMSRLALNPPRWPTSGRV